MSFIIIVYHYEIESEKEINTGLIQVIIDTENKNTYDVINSIKKLINNENSQLKSIKEISKIEIKK